jgi:peptidoglycan/xylan/chitin deacetylase (PgdA/CDA1 family)
VFIKSLLGQARRYALARWRQKKLPLDGPGPIVSFTFDDFPRSAYEAGGAILKSYGAHGTYYAAMGLQGKINHQGEHFAPEDLEHLLADGHDLGSHTYSHISSRRSKPEAFCADVARGERALDPWRDPSRAGHFAYPYGEITFLAKARIGSSMRSCRSIMPGIMTSSADLSMLPANSIYARDFDPQLIEQMLSPAQLRRGWVIFYTHDVRESPSDFGCTPRQLEFVVRQAVRVLGARVMTMSEAVESLTSDSVEEGSGRVVIPDAMRS